MKEIVEERQSIIQGSSGITELPCGIISVGTGISIFTRAIQQEPPNEKKIRGLH